MSAHLSEWTLRRLHTGELPETETRQAQVHLADCAQCRGVAQGLVQEQARFEAQLPFERFAAGVEHAAAQAVSAGHARPSRGWMAAAAAAAAAVLLVVAVRPLLSEPPEPTHRLKGGATAELRIGGQGAQRVATSGATERLAPGERVRLGYTAGQHRYVLAVAVDAAGVVSALYPEAGQSLPVEAGPGMHWLPESLEFTGSGEERVVVVLSSEPLEVEAVRAAARQAFEKGGRSVAAMPALSVAGEQTHWVLRKP